MSSLALRGARRLTKSKYVYATHKIPIECDVYTADDFPATSPAFLYFHSGGLVTGSRSCVPPWLVQATFKVCFRNKWPLVSASYRLLPQARALGLFQDAGAAYRFAARLPAPDGTPIERKVIVGGGSAGFFMASLTAHWLTPPPIALLSVTGITTFRHRFFNCSVSLTPEPITLPQIGHYLEDPVSVGTVPADNPQVFHLDKLLPDGSKNINFKAPEVPISEDEKADKFPRGGLYDYYLHNNAFTLLVSPYDAGYEWAKAKDDDSEAKLRAWPPTTIIQGDADHHVDLAVSTHMVDCLGEHKVKLFLARGQPHRYEATRFLEDDVDGMDAVRQAVANLEADVALALGQ
ncbi:endomembrane protein 70-like protein [Colletotrichum karsti]|uniref:Endomembrane protein 70-like protein n=1 Tax=Colletotrichum karsti TaxID=1095194 RepID=A0A9P6IGM5_9PEZI|nr:endomembrane protein 70-like protein [Colletotrichum karsti]KAF9880236.1 endomembrane protein 70-like protein [Colletotrichum karsti]